MKNTLLEISWENNPLPIASKENLNNLLEEVKTHGVVDVKKFDPQKDETYIKAFETSELPGCVICIFNSRKAMNEVLFRASLFVETTDCKLYFTNGEYFSDDPLEAGQTYGADRKFVDYAVGNTPAYDGIRGYDLPGKKLNAFLAKAAQDKTLPAKNQTYAAMEAEFLDFLRTLRRKYGDDYSLITSIAIPAFISITSHEFLHAQYFSDARLRENVDEYVASHLSDREIKLLIKCLKSSIYTTIEEDIYYRNNEIFAYMLGKNEYEDSSTRGGLFYTRALCVLKHNTPPEDLTEPAADCFDAMYKAWAENDFGQGVSADKLAEISGKVFEEYKSQLPGTLDVKKGAFYKYLTAKGTAPIIVE
ncbi:MAG: hypothetical protein LBL61_01850 [Elusimicrobiota bacterium]|jgi:hypothetical protein|nr:hypothetical protein [Elusimicrobiota bacterium]